MMKVNHHASPHKSADRTGYFIENDADIGNRKNNNRFIKSDRIIHRHSLPYAFQQNSCLRIIVKSVVSGKNNYHYQMQAKTCTRNKPAVGISKKRNNDIMYI